MSAPPAAACRSPAAASRSWRAARCPAARRSAYRARSRGSSRQGSAALAPWRIQGPGVRIVPFLAVSLTRNESRPHRHLQIDAIHEAPMLISTSTTPLRSAPFQLNSWLAIEETSTSTKTDSTMPSGLSSRPNSTTDPRIHNSVSGPSGPGGLPHPCSTASRSAPAHRGRRVPAEQKGEIPRAHLGGGSHGIAACDPRKPRPTRTNISRRQSPFGCVCARRFSSTYTKWGTALRAASAQSVPGMQAHTTGMDRTLGSRSFSQLSIVMTRGMSRCDPKSRCHCKTSGHDAHALHHR